MKLEMDIKLRAAVRYDDEAAVWVSWCPALDVYSQGTSRVRAQAAIEEALVMYVRFCYQKKILGQVLSNRGFTASKPDKTATHSGGDEVFEEFISVRSVQEHANARTVQEQAKHTPSIFDVIVPLPLVAAAGLLPRMNNTHAAA